MPFSWWYPTMLLGSLLLLVAAIFTQPSRSWSLWLPLFGSAILAAFFVPATVEMLQAYLQRKTVDGMQVADRFLVVVFVLISLGIPLAAGMRARSRSTMTS